ncbi:conserved Plasmodium protein, unknown function [Plasmodium ovale]|uniref:Uncharacterized protein n=1 Tax=Plasmodium ovale TaxID=36330 RepID=A0A1D3U9Z0_PLAOA|nr:conserved Plasmodium protein, unknown function [Plasmodium ovale]
MMRGGFPKWLSRNLTAGTKKSDLYCKEKRLNLCVAFNNNVNIFHERMDTNFYMYDVSSTIFKLLKYIHIFKNKYKNCAIKGGKEKDLMDNKLQQIFMCYISIYNNINRNLFLKLTQAVFNFPPLLNKVMDDKEFYEQLLLEIIKCSEEEKIDKMQFYEQLIKILSILLRVINFFSNVFEREFFLQAIIIVNKEENITNFINNFTFLLSCLSFYKRSLKTKSNNSRGETCTSLPQQLFPDCGTFQTCEKINLLQNCTPIILEIFNKLKMYKHFSTGDVCNIFDFLNEFKQFHEIKIWICKDISTYFTTSSEIKNLCLFFYFITSCKNFNEKMMYKETYAYIYNILFLRRNELNDIKNMNFFLLSMIKCRNHEKAVINSHLKRRKIKMVRNRIDTIFTKRKEEAKKKNAIKPKGNKKFELCLLLKKRFIKKQKMVNEKIMYFFIKSSFMHFLKKKKLNKKYIKTFYQYFLPYHITKNCTRKKNYVSPIPVILNLEQI